MSLYEKYKRPILIGVALVCLVIFSITGVMMTVIEGLFRPASPEKIVLADGRKVSVTEEDYHVGQRLYRLHAILVGNGMQTMDMPAFVFAGLSPDFTDSPSETFAILRRAAVEQGIDVSDADVERVRNFACRAKLPLFRQQNQQPPQPIAPRALARALSVGSVGDLDDVIREAIRISTLVRLEMLGSLDLSDAALAAWIESKRKHMTLSYVAYEGADYKKELERLPPTNQDLESWLTEQDESTQSRWRDPVIATMSRVGLLYDEADISDFVTELEGVEIGDADIEQRYNEDRERLYKIDPPKKKQDDEDKGKDAKNPDAKSPDAKKPDAKKPDAKKPDAKNPDAKKPDAKKPDAKKPDAKSPDAKKPDAKKPDAKKPDAKKPDAKNSDKADQESADQYRPLAEVKASIEKKLKLEAALRKLLESAQSEYETWVKLDAEHEKKNDEKKQDEKKPDEKKPDEKKSDEEKNDEKKQDGKPKQAPVGPPPAPFRLETWYQNIAKGRKGLIFTAATDTPKAPEKFQKLADFGNWDSYWAVGSMEKAGQLSGSIQRAEKGCFIFQIGERKTNVLRPMDQIRKELLESYFTTESGKKAKEKAEALRKLVRTKAEGLEKEKTDKLRAEVATRLAAKITDWAKEREDKIAAKQAHLDANDVPDSARDVLGKQIEALKAELANKADQEKTFKEAIEKEIDGEIAKAVEPRLGEAFDAAVAELKLTPAKVGPFFTDVKDPTGDPLFSLRDPSAEKFLMSSPDLLDKKKGWVSKPLEDSTNNSWYVVRIDDVAPAGSGAVTRRQLAVRRPEFTAERVRNVLQFGYGSKFLKARYKFEGR